MNRRLAIMMSLLLSTGVVMAYEQPRYTIVQHDADFELRQYQAYVVAEIEVRAPFAEAGNVAFRPLADYIFGKNRGAEKMQMTSPVTQTPKGEKIGMTAPVIQGAGKDGVYVVSFVMPSRYTLKTLPAPEDNRIRFREVPPALIAARTYRGGWSEERYAKEERALLAAISKSKLTPLGPPVWARYNPPFWPWFLRRNEILIDVRK